MKDLVALLKAAKGDNAKLCREAAREIEVLVEQGRELERALARASVKIANLRRESK